MAVPSEPWETQSLTVHPRGTEVCQPATQDHCHILLAPSGALMVIMVN